VPAGSVPILRSMGNRTDWTRRKSEIAQTEGIPASFAELSFSLRATAFNMEFRYTF